MFHLFVGISGYPTHLFIGCFRITFAFIIGGLFASAIAGTYKYQLEDICVYIGLGVLVWTLILGILLGISYIGIGN